MSNPYRILLVDDHELFRAGIVSVLEPQQGVEIVGEASDGFEALALVRELTPDLVLMDINMPICDGLSALRIIKHELPEIKVVMVTVSEEDEDVFQAVKEGADGYLLKNLGRKKLLDAILRLKQGEAVISGVLAARILREFRQPGSNEDNGVSQEKLTAREIDVLKRVAAGDSNKQIAETLNITENTAKIHVANILAKLHLRNRVEAAVFAVEEGLKPNSDKE